MLNGLGRRRTRLRVLRMLGMRRMGVFRRVCGVGVRRVGRRMVWVMAVVGPCAVLGRWRVWLPGSLSGQFARAVELDGERVRLNDELGIDSADLGKVAVDLLLALHGLLVLVGALGDLLGGGEVGVEGAEVDARDPDGA
jgi:hypothetical protein